MIAKELIKELQKLEDNTEVCVLDDMGFGYKEFDIIYDEDENTASIKKDYNFIESIDLF